jgi:hypothetical protein
MATSPVVLSALPVIAAGGIRRVQSTHGAAHAAEVQGP